MTLRVGTQGLETPWDPPKTRDLLGASDQKSREGCGCPKFLAGRGSPADVDAAGKHFPDIPGSTRCYPYQGLRTFWQGKWLLENRPRLRERSWIFCHGSMSHRQDFRRNVAPCMAVPAQEHASSRTSPVLHGKKENRADSPCSVGSIFTR